MGLCFVLGGGRCAFACRRTCWGGFLSLTVEPPSPLVLATLLACFCSEVEWGWFLWWWFRWLSSASFVFGCGVAVAVGVFGWGVVFVFGWCFVWLPWAVFVVSVVGL